MRKTYIKHLKYFLPGTEVLLTDPNYNYTDVLKNYKLKIQRTYVKIYKNKYSISYRVFVENNAIGPGRFFHVEGNKHIISVDNVKPLETVSEGDCKYSIGDLLFAFNDGSYARYAHRYIAEYKQLTITFEKDGSSDELHYTYSLCMVPKISPGQYRYRAFKKQVHVLYNELDSGAIFISRYGNHKQILLNEKEYKMKLLTEGIENL